ncbi:unnamed protein product [Rodentolepis nana]|uniref:ChSh domain-containing protein n=1 Tax=Rodentolepis nana TaxID=102285 RepID=A0A0R3TS26_RODNA|nr:unnamed protein product [Rodentolepis nana]
MYFAISRRNSLLSVPLTKQEEGGSHFPGEKDPEMANIGTLPCCSGMENTEKGEKPPRSPQSLLTSNVRDDSTAGGDIKKNTARRRRSRRRGRNIGKLNKKSFAKRRKMKVEGNFNPTGPETKPTTAQRRSRRHSLFRSQVGQLKKRQMGCNEAGLGLDDGADTSGVTVFGITTINGDLMFILHIAGVAYPFLMSPSEANARYPDAVIQFYENRLTFRVPSSKKKLK